MKFLNSDGLRTVLSKIKEKFATKEELQELAKKSDGGGYEEIVVRVQKEYEFYFKLIKIGRRVDVFQMIEASNAVDVLPNSFKADKGTCIGVMYKIVGRNYFSTSTRTYGLFVNYTLGLTEEIESSFQLKYYFNYGVTQIYIGSYITKE